MIVPFFSQFAKVGLFPETTKKKATKFQNRGFFPVYLLIRFAKALQNSLSFQWDRFPGCRAQAPCW
jgi:hypothetical protein